MLIVGLLFSFMVTSLEFYFKAKRRRLLDGVRFFFFSISKEILKNWF